MLRLGIAARNSARPCGSHAPSIYLESIQQQHGQSEADQDAILRTHLIEPAHLRNDDFDAFYEARSKALAGLVAGAMRKPVVEEAGTDEAEIDVTEGEDELEAA